MEAGAPLGIKHCGYYAMHALRIEKFYAFWGQDLDSQTTPFECGRSFRVKSEHKNNVNRKLDFIGKKAMEQQKKVDRKLMFYSIRAYNIALANVAPPAKIACTNTLGEGM